MMRFIYCAIISVSASFSIAMAPISELLIECKKLPGFYDISGSWVKGFENSEELNIDDPSQAIAQVKDYIDKISGLSEHSKIQRINGTHESLIRVILLIAERSQNIGQAREIVNATMESLRVLNDQVPESNEKNYLIASLEIMTHFLKTEESLLEIEKNIVQHLGKAIIQMKAGKISSHLTKVVLGTIKLIALERERQKMPIAAAP